MKKYFIFLTITIFACTNVSEKKKYLSEQKNVQINREKTVKDSLVSVIQYFEFESKKEFKVKGKEGSEIYFSANNFLNYSGKVEIELIEAYNYFDIILNNLDTRNTKGNLLETKGMINIIAKDTLGDALSLSKPIKIKFKGGNNASYDLYNGSTKNNKIIWELGNINGTGKKSNKKYYAKSLIGYAVNRKTNISTPVYDSIEVGSENEKRLLESLKLGWLNLDKIYSENCNKDVTILTGNSFENFSFYLIANNFNIIISEDSRIENTISFKKISDKVNFDCVGFEITGGNAFVVMGGLDEIENSGFHRKQIKKMPINELKKLLSLKFK